MTKNERLQRRFERRLLNVERWQNSKECMTMSKEWHKYMEGHEMLSGEFRTLAGARVFGEQVWEDHKRDRATAQFDFEGDLHWNKVTPIKVEPTPEELHLARPVELGQEIVQYTIPYPTVEERLVEARQQIENCKHP